MKNRVIAAGIVALLAAAPAFAADSASVEATLIQMEKDSWVAWQNHDGKFYEGFLSGDHTEMGFGGPSTKADVIAGVKSGCTVKSYSVDKFKVTQFSDDTALVTYHAAQDTMCGTYPVPSPVWVSSLYVKRDGKWLNALYQQTAKP
jgi:hypothetical protein